MRAMPDVLPAHGPPVITNLGGCTILAMSARGVVVCCFNNPSFAQVAPIDKRVRAGRQLGSREERPPSPSLIRAIPRVREKKEGGNGMDGWGGEQATSNLLIHGR